MIQSVPIKNFRCLLLVRARGFEIKEGGQFLLSRVSEYKQRKILRSALAKASKISKSALVLTLLVSACHGSPPSGSQPSPQVTTMATAPPPTASQQAAVPPSPASSTQVGGASARMSNFDNDADGSVPVGFSFARTGDGPLGRWVVRAESDAPSRPHVLAQLDTDDADFRFPMAVADTPVLRDMRVSVRCKMVSGKVDQACGLVFRYLDERNYFVTRANALENNIRFYTVKDGRRKQLASFSGTVAPNVWHDYAVEIRGDHIQIFWNGTQVLDHKDTTFPEAGKVGVWTKADSVTYFDDLTVTSLVDKDRP